MVNTSKILTVSYGTFSCTLEGFDDSFETMKAIAEYFRDLASDDRYFGAEPPTPDAEMLARIAEREIARRVEAHEDQGRIVLRAGDAPTLAVAAADAVAEDHEDQSDEDQNDLAAETAEAPVRTFTAAAPPVSERPVVARQPEEPAAEEVSTAEVRKRVAEFTAPAPQVVDSADIAEDISVEGTEEEPVTDATADDAADESDDTPAMISAVMQEDVVLADTIPSEDDEIPADLAEENAEDAVAIEEAASEEPSEEEAVSEVVTEAPVEEDSADVTADELDAQAEEAAEKPAEEPAEETELETPFAEDEAEAEELVANIGAEDFVAQSEATEDEEAVETAEEFFKNSPDPDEVSYYESEAVDGPVTDPEFGSVADRLSRIRSVVAQADQSYEQDDYSEDEHAQDFLSETAAELGAALAEDDANELETAEAEDTDVMDVDLIAALAGQHALADDDDEGPEDAAPEDVSDADEHEDTLSQLLADSVPAEETAEETEEDVAEFEAADEPAAEMTEDDTEDDVVGFVVPEAPADEAEMPAMFDEAPAELSASVVKVKREEFEAALAESMQDSDDEAEHASDDAAEADQTLSPEDEEDLQRALAEVEADLLPEDAAEMAEDAAVADDAPEDEAHQDAPQEVARTGLDKLERAEGNSDIERIFDEADSQLEKPESNQRRSAIQHLRAAVAATRAEKKAGSDLQKDVDDAPYRSDLASVVRPRRPSTSDGTAPRSQRPSEGRPAPLKLVAEQRIDTDQEPVRPRRVSAAEMEADSAAVTPENAGSFGDYAKAMGATQLPDLLEAAAAYISDVEGREQFSRPMLMHKVKEVEQENFAREDGLRSFGQLLREGKIQKIKGGRFTVTEETDFRDEARHAG